MKDRTTDCLETGSSLLKAMVRALWHSACDILKSPRFSTLSLSEMSTGALIFKPLIWFLHQVHVLLAELWIWPLLWGLFLFWNPLLLRKVFMADTVLELFPFISAWELSSSFLSALSPATLYRTWLKQTNSQFPLRPERTFVRSTISLATFRIFCITTGNILPIFPQYITPCSLFPASNINFLNSFRASSWSPHYPSGLCCHWVPKPVYRF